eukprot:CAMPEP_0201636882 /NCGR_PEP_ID=MMETSP0493-20130528/10264_1 /ASSEMBLY_ACC=CAM_ASM_000838 /TAXON_ID=420259 /ORGANISM="Thalassiosira gravida, Strain GMp14c1" /LENGTH=261 /DNA_ID=CAMNT_0048109173 /DNA_START=19 /DNA_END=804 /DNA_ORIENTATION=+
MASRIFPSSSYLVQAPLRRAINRSTLNKDAARCGVNFSSLSRTSGTTTTTAAATDGGWPRSSSRGLSHLQQRWLTKNNNGLSHPATTPSLFPLHTIQSNFSTAAMPQKSEPAPSQQPVKTVKKKRTNKQRKSLRSRNPLIITPTAAARIQFLISAHNRNSTNPAMGIRLGTKKRGCNGLSYTLNYAYADHMEKHGRDEAMIIRLAESDMVGDGLMVYVEPMALMNVIGTTMDFEDDEMSSEFTFTNPNSKGECGCGESFNV